MDYEAIRAELDQDYAWRLDEIRFFQNQSSELDEAESMVFDQVKFELNCKPCENFFSKVN